MNLRKSFIFVLTLLFIGIFAGCDNDTGAFDPSKVDEIKIHFDTNEGTDISTIVVNEALLNTIDVELIKDVELEDLDFLNPTKEGCTFVGWYLDEKLTDELSEDSPILMEYLNNVDTENIKIEVTIYAKWEEVSDELDTFTITYHLDGGSNDLSNITSFTEGDNDFTLQNPIKEGYTFSGWYSDASYSSNVEVIRNLTDDLELYALFVENSSDNDTFTITYHLDGGTNSNENITQFTTNDNAFTLIPPTKEGYTFAGWFVDSEFTTSIQVIRSLSTSLDLYAKWTQDVDTSMFYFYLDGDEYRITGLKYGFSGDLVIPSVYNGYPVTAIGDDAFGYETGITSVTIPDSITSIGSTAFQYDEGITSLVIPETVTFIGSSAFANMDSLVSITLPSNMTEIPMYLFNGCDSLNDVTIPDGVTTIKRQAFSFMDSLTTITIPDSVVTIEEASFSYSKNLTEIIIPSSVTTMQGFVFSHCDNLVVKSPREGAPYSWDYRWNILDSNNNLVPVTWNFDVNAPVYTVNYHLDGGTNNILNPSSYRDDVMLNVPTKEGFLFKGWYTDSSFTNRITSLEAVGDLTIDIYAYWYEDSAPQYLDYEVYDDHVVVTGMNQDVTEIEIPATYLGLPVTEIADKAFYLKRQLETVILHENLVVIGESAFGGNYNITSMNFPSTLTTLKDGSLHMTGFTELVLPDTIVHIGDYVLSDSENLVSVTLPSTMTVVPKAMFRDVDTLLHITLPDSVIEIQDEAFAGCMALESLNLENVRVLGDNACTNCQSLTEIVLSDDLTIIPEYAFAYNNNLTSVHLPENLVYIRRGAFANVDNLGTMDFPDTLVEIGESAFWAARFTEISLPSSLKIIGDEAFRYNNFTTLYLPSSLDSVGKLAFRYCEELEHIYLSTDIDYLGERVFRDTSNQAIIHMYGDNTGEWSPEWKDYFYGQTDGSGISFININYTLDGGINHEDNPIALRSGDSFVLQAPSKDGYYFDGWYLEESFTTEVTGIKQGNVDNILLYAKWVENDSTNASITYHLNGGRLLDNAPTYYVLTNTTPLVNPTKPGWTFIGWYTDSKMTNKISEIDATMTGDLDLYATFEMDYLNYEEFDDYVKITGLRQPLTTVEIPSTINNKPVTIIGENAFIGELSVRHVVLPSTINVIEQGAFSVKNITTINLPEGLEEIGNNAFNSTYYLSEITIPSTVTTIGEGVFTYNRNLSSITFNNDITHIPNNMFKGCNSLTEITLPEGVESIGNSAFHDCENLESVLLPSTLLTIGNAAFRNTRLTTISLPENLDEIKPYAFYESTLTNLVIPDSVYTLGEHVFDNNNILKSLTIGKNVSYEFSHSDFYNMDSLGEIIVSGENTSLQSIDGVLFDIRDGMKLVKYPIMKKGLYYDVPNGVTEISRKALYETDLKEIVLPNSVVAIRYDGIGHSNELSVIYIPSSVTVIENYALSGITDLIIYTDHASKPANWGQYMGDDSFVIHYNVTKEDVKTYMDAFEYIVSDDHIGITRFLGNSVTIDIPAEIDGIPVTTIHSKALVDMSGQILITEAITTIEANAFDSANINLYIEAYSPPSGWDSNWNSNKGNVTTDVIWFKLDAQGGTYHFPITGTGSNLASIGYGYEPAKEGYVFGGWYTDIECTEGNEYFFKVYPQEPDTQPNYNVTLYAKWVLAGE